MAEQKKMAKQNGPSRDVGGPSPREHSLAQAWLSLAGLLPSRARLRFTWRPIIEVAKRKDTSQTRSPGYLKRDLKPINAATITTT